MKPKFLWLVILLGACQPTAKPPTTHQQKQAVLDSIADRCGMPRQVWELISDDQLMLRPAPDAPYEKVDCLIGELQKSKLHVRLGFIGNEAFVGNTQ